MSNFFEHISAGDIIPILAILLIFGGSFVVALTAVLGRTVHRIRRDADAARLKQDMLDRGMSAEEIKTVLEAGVKK